MCMTEEELAERNKKLIERIMGRYHRKVIAHPEGALVHFGDCWWYACQICNCGLHADLGWIGYDKGAELYPKFHEELIVSEMRRYQLQSLPVPVPKVLTKEEEAEFKRQLDEIFGKPGEPAKEWLNKDDKK